MAIKLPRKLKKALKKAVLRPYEVATVWKTKELKILSIEKHYHSWKKLPTVGHITVTRTELNSKTLRRLNAQRIYWSAHEFKKEKKAEPKYSGSEIVEKVCLPIHKAKKHEMDSDMTELMIMLYNQKETSIFNKVDAEEIPFLCAVILKRIKHCHTFTCNDDRLVLFLAAAAETPGTAIMFLWYIQYYCFTNQVKQIDLQFMGMKIFPMGFPSKHDLSTIWDAQKTSDGKNLVDINAAGASIHF